MNWYIYCENNPVLSIDPLGLESHYIFYNDSDKSNYSLFDRAKAEYQYLLSIGIDKSEIMLKSISTEAEFIDTWNGMKPRSIYESSSS